MQALQLQTKDQLQLDAVLHRPAGRPRGLVLQAHGITADMDEGGMFARLADDLVAADFTVLRFSFRGHGLSGGRDVGMTIAGEMLDLEAALEHLERQVEPDAPAGTELPLIIVAASFGAVSAMLSLPLMARSPNGLVLWNPVLDLIHTFVEPELPWGQANFGAQVDLLPGRGYIEIDGDFKLGRVAYEEMRHYGRAPFGHFVASKMPALVVHGDRDTYVSYDIAKQAAAERAAAGGPTDFHTVVGSDHGFDSREREDEAIQVTVQWLGRNSP